MVLPDKAGKEFVNKITRLLNAWVDHSCLKDAALKAIMAPQVCYYRILGLCPIGIREVLRRIPGKVVVSTIQEDITESVGTLNFCAGREAGSEAAVHAMHEIRKNKTLGPYFLSMEQTRSIQ